MDYGHSTYSMGTVHVLWPEYMYYGHSGSWTEWLRRGGLGAAAPKEARWFGRPQAPQWSRQRNWHLNWQRNLHENTKKLQLNGN